MKKFYLPIFLFLCSITLMSCGADKEEKDKNAEDQYHHTDEAGFSYETFKDDPTGLRLYTLDNGLKVYLGKNEEEPKIQTLIAVRAGSTYDPADNTGLAHYLEHMVFKGTDKIGTQDWETEKVLLDSISDLYEKHKAEQDPEKKKAIYAQIDSVSQKASEYSIANEYDKMVASLGAEGTNAFTSNEQTVYVNKIPSNELDKWLNVESERFSNLVLRLFHTELEAVYEEFNRGQDSDGRKQYQATLEGLFPTHPYGTQSTIGKSEHLKNPSMEAIHNYFDKYYVPNNMAVVLVGDIDYDATIKKVNEAFGEYEKKEVSHPSFPEEQPITAPVEKEVFGPTSESVYVAFRTDGVGSEDQKLVTLIDYILANSQAGLIDLDLNQQQKVQRASSYTNFNNDYGFHLLYGMPKANQSLEEVKDLLLAEVEKVKKGEFDDWLVEAVINDLKLSEIRQYEDASSTAYAYMDSFIHFQDWQDQVDFINDLKSVTKEDLVNYANKHYKDNYVAVYKRKGEDTTIAKVENPGITPVQLNRDKQSDFIKAFNKKESPALEPQYVDYEQAIQNSKTESGLPIAYIENENNDLFNLYIIFDMGQDNDKELSLAAGYLDYLGTEKLSPEEVKQEFYKLGINYFVSSGNDKTYVGLSGLKENLPEGLALLEDLWSNAKADQETYDKYVDQILKGREDNKTQKGNILFDGLMNYGRYGENSRLRDIYSAEELKNKNPEELVQKVKDMRNYKQRIFYYGKDFDKAVAAIDENHQLPAELKDYPQAKEYKEVDTGKKVYFVDYDMVQAEMVFLSKGEDFSPEKMAATELFNTYFGSGLSSIVFQEIRESQSLAYSAYSAYQTAKEKDKPNYVMAYIGTQANKLPQAVDAMMELMTNMPEAEEQFQSAKEATLKQIAADRITKTSIFWNYESLKKRGMDHDYREEMYNAIKDMTMEDLKEFFNNNIKGQDYNVMVIGNKEDVDMQSLSKLGEVEELDIDYLFNYEKSSEDIKL
ncbi:MULTISPECIES: M16 family metallopeptidase [Mesonia]|uniref:Protease 3 n=1 Tax=Mesonia oceanica TaxID=2687242 RepID=A0AC61YC82_9FLAO|nr:MULTISPECIES: M16 family metallopeptidase [Mesonia]MAN27131.1 peptidase M16 [Mesonia sp.]MBJ97627.1 peptidase M16 [Flavobacteriaceae bacterium]VVV02119.1 Protease 3 [Mesonia oceanica]|tara:strand:+ start:40603 stop:43584 length:2982 start_codon:yes stop_codon:yes gene_type:complete